MRRVCFPSAPLVLALLPAVATLRLASTQGYVPTWPCPYLSQATYTNWVDAVDLDHDGQPEFLQWSFVAYQYCLASPTSTWFDSFTDGTEALFAREHVQLFVELHIPRVFVTPVLTNAQPIVPQPQPGGPADLFWEWNAPEAMASLQIVGLGVGSRCYRFVGPDPNPPCQYSSYGYLSSAATNCLFGFRIFRPDGWHLGWLRMVYEYRGRPVGVGGWAQLAEYDIHPEPNTEIRAGEYAQPRLQVRYDGDQVIVSWPADYRTCTLERATRLDPPNWLPGPPATTNVAVFDASDAPWYFRLKR